MEVFKIVVFFCTLVGFHLPDVICSVHHYRLLDNLLSNYSVLVRPVKDPKTVTDVHLEFFLAQVIEMDEKRQTLKINAWLTLRWVDEYLRWNVSDHGGVYNLKIPSEQIWMPDVVLYDNADDHYYNFLKGKIAVVYNDGEIMWASPVILRSHCQIDVTYFPFDSQECRLKFGPWQHEGNEVNLTGGGDQSVFKSDGEWDMTGVTTNNNVQFYPDAPGIPYTDVTFYVHLKRRSLYYVFNLIMPCGLISAVTLLTFLLPPESGEKISLAITVLLSLTVFLLLVAETMPPASVVPVIGQYYASTMVTVTLSLAMSVAVLKVHYKTPETHPMPTWLKRIIYGRVGRFFGISKAQKKPKVKSNGIEMSQKINMTIDGNICNVVRRMDGSDSPIFGRKHNGNLRSGKPKTTTMSSHDDCPIMHHLLAEFKRVSSFYDWKNRHEHAQNEWRLCAILLDRIFMIIYMLCCLCTVLLICVQLEYS